MSEKTSSLRFALVVCLILAALVTAVYWQVREFELVGLDDDSYIPQNAYVLLGLRHDTIRWAFSAVYQGIWHPMIWLSYMSDTEIARWLAQHGIRLGPGGVGVYHVTNAVQHLLSSIILFLIFLRITGSRWRSAFVATVFAVHPLNVESVAWVAERKNTLSTLLCLVTMLAYLNYVRRPGLARYGLTILLLALGLMAKAVLVTVPIMLLLIDYWPLKRFDVKTPWSLVREKLPMFAMAAASGVMAFIAQRMGGLVAPDEVFPLGVRVANAFVSILKYVWLMVVPRNLSVCYVHPGRSIPEWLVVLCAFTVVAITWAVIRYRAKIPYLFVGWTWYLATILPVIGIVQVADQGLADRYIYIPMVGLLIVAAWGSTGVLRRLPLVRSAPAFAAACCIVVLAFAATARTQTSYWRDSVKMYRQVIAVNPTSRTGYSGLGSALMMRGSHTEARSCLRKAIEIDHRDVTSRINLGISFAMQRKLDEAAYYLHEALDMRPEEPKGNYNLARILVMQGRTKEAAGYYARAVESQPAFVEAQLEFGNVLFLLGKTGHAIERYRTAIRLRPNWASAHVLLAGAMESRKQLDGAISHYRAALRLDPKRWDAANNLAWILATQSHPSYSNPREAIRLAETTCRIARQGNPQLLDTLAVAYAANGRYDKAAETARKALRLAETAKQESMTRQLRARLRDYEARLSRGI